MRKKAIIIGWVSLFVVLSGTTVLRLVGVDDAGVAPAFGVPPSGGCPPNSYCFKNPYQQPVCTFIPCCPEGQNFCDDIQRVSIASYPKLVTPNGPGGSCWSFGPSEVDVCEYWQCGDAFLCAEPSCTAIATHHVTARLVAVNHGGSCEVEGQ
jgi:hypothetical protein